MDYKIIAFRTWICFNLCMISCINFAKRYGISYNFLSEYLIGLTALKYEICKIYIYIYIFGDFIFFFFLLFYMSTLFLPFI
jgi:hypothetical protein